MTDEEFKVFIVEVMKFSLSSFMKCLSVFEQSISDIEEMTADDLKKLMDIKTNENRTKQ